jgi:protein-L-isoaspartate(D-aspartate) O-methyltransferase
MESEVNFSQQKRKIKRHLDELGVRDPEVLKALDRVQREKFIPEELLPVAYIDHPLPIEEAQTISQPSLVAFMTQELKLNETSRVLEIGTGSGYQTALLAELAGDVYTVEIRKTLSEAAQKLLHDLGYRNIHFKVGDGSEGWSEKAPFDAIIVTAEALELPAALTGQLKNKGRMIIPLKESFGQGLYLLSKSPTRWKKERLFSVQFVPLVSLDFLDS